MSLLSTAISMLKSFSLFKREGVPPQSTTAQAATASPFQNRLKRVPATVRSAFSAVETQKSKSSIVAMNVASFPSAAISVNTQLPCLTVLMTKPAGALKLSGETAQAMESAVFESPYSSFIVASKIFAPQLLSHQLVNSANEILNLIYGHLSARSHVVTSALSAVFL